MKNWVNHISVCKWSLQYLANLAKKGMIINWTSCYHEFKSPILMVTDLKTQMYFSPSKSL